MKKLKENLRLLTLIVFMPIMSYLYTILNHIPAHAHNIAISLDQSIPFVSIFVLPYMFWHLFIPLSFALLCFLDKKAYLKTMLVYIVGCLIANLIFGIYQTTLPRAILNVTDWTTNLVRIIYKNDNPVNCFPSIHVFTSYMMLRTFLSLKANYKPAKFAVSIGSILIILSTVLIKQHTILDGLGGILLGEILINLVNYYEVSLGTLYLRKFFKNYSLKSIFEPEDNTLEETEEEDYKMSI